MEKESIFIRALRSVLYRLFRTYWFKAHVLKKKIDINLCLEMLSKKNIAPLQLKKEDFLLDSEHFDEDKMKSVENRLADASYLPYGIKEDGELIYSCWIALKYLSLPVKRFRMELHEDEGYLEDDYTVPAARGKGIHQYMLWYRQKIIFENNRKNAVIIINDENKPALHSAMKCGFEKESHFYYGKILGIDFWTLNRL